MSSLTSSLTSKILILCGIFILILLDSAFIKPRCKSTWASCYSSLDGSVQVIPFHLINHASLMLTPTMTQFPMFSNYSAVDPRPQTPLSTQDDEDLDLNSQPKNSTGTEMYTIKTKFRPSLDRNTQVEYNEKSDKKRHKFTEKERGYAALATNCESLEDLDSKVGFFCACIFHH